MGSGRKVQMLYRFFSGYLIYFLVFLGVSGIMARRKISGTIRYFRQYLIFRFTQYLMIIKTEPDGVGYGKNGGLQAGIGPPLRPVCRVYFISFILIGTLSTWPLVLLPGGLTCPLLLLQKRCLFCRHPLLLLLQQLLDTTSLR